MATSDKLITDATGQIVGTRAYTFSRAAATVDDDGNAVASGAMRFGRAQVFTELREFEDHDSATNGYGLIVSGKDADSSTPLRFVIDGGNAWKVQRGEGLTLMASGNATRSGVEGGDLLQGYANQDANLAYSPKSGHVCHGMIRVNCERWHWTGTEFESRGFATLYSQDYAETWTIEVDDNGDELPEVDAGTRRGNLWQDTGYTPVDAQALEVWFAVTDYRVDGGWQCKLNRARRSAVGQPYVVEPFILFEDTQFKHGHSALFFLPSDAAYNGHGQLIVSGGDGSEARTWRFICTDPENYLDPASWGAAQEFFGGGEDPIDADKGSVNQWAAARMLGYGSASAIVATDILSCALIKLTVPADESDTARAQYDRLWGYASRYYDPLWVDGCPETSGPYVSRTTASLSAEEQRVLYSPDGENWTVIARTNDGGKASVPVIYGSKIVFMGIFTGSTTRCLPLPTRYVTRKPLRIGPGGTNRVHPGTWRTDVFGAVAAGSVASFPSRNTLDIDAPTPASAAVMRVTTEGGNVGTEFINIMPWSGEASDVPAGKMSFRYQLRTVGNLRLQLRHSLGSGSAPLFDMSPNLHVRQWTPMVGNTDASGQSNPFGLYMWVWHHPNPASTGIKFQQSEEQSPDIVYIGASAYPILGYSVTPSTTGPDEDFKPSLPFTGATWTYGRALRLPHDSNVGSDFGSDVPSVPLFTLYGDADNYVEFIADTANDQLTMNVCIDGSVTAEQMTGIFWEREDHVRIAVSSDGSAIAASASISGGPVLTASVDGVLSTQPQDARAEAADGTTACVDWFGEDAIDGVAYDDGQRSALVTGTGLAEVVDATGTPLNRRQPVGHLAVKKLRSVIRNAARGRRVARRSRFGF